jgi:WD40 repeat protein
MMQHLSQTLLLTALCLLASVRVAAQKPDIVVQSGHHQTVYALAISPDKRLLASGGTDNVIIIWDAARGIQLYSLRGHSQWVFSLSFNPQGNLLASGSADGTVSIWDVFRGVRVDELSIRPAGVTSVEFSPDGSTLAISSNDKVIRLWDRAAKRITTEMRGHSETVYKILFSRDGKYLVSISEDKTLRLWEVASGKEESSVSFPKETANSNDVSMALSPDGNVVAAAVGSTVLFWNLRTKEKTIVDYPADEKTKKSEDVEGLIFASNEALACQLDEKIFLWDFKNAKVTPLADAFINTGSAITISKDLSMLAFSHDENVEIYDMSTKQIKALRGNFDFMRSSINLAFPSDNNSLIAKGRETYIFGDLLDIDDAEAIDLIVRLKGPRFAYVPSINSLANFGDHADGKKDRQPDITLERNPWGKKPEKSVVKAHVKPITALAANPHKALAATCNDEEETKIWDVNDWSKPKKILPEHSYHVVFSPDGEQLLTASDEGLKLWDVTTWKNYTIPTTEKGAPGHGRFWEPGFSPDGSMIVSVISNEGVNQELTLWRKDGQMLFKFELEPIPASWRLNNILNTAPFPTVSLGMILFNVTGFDTGWGPLSFSHDSSMVAYQYTNVITGYLSIKVWDTRSGKEMHELVGHSGTIRSTAFSRSGKILASSGIDNTVKLWSMKTGKELATFELLGDKRWVIHTPDGRFDTNTDLESDALLHWSIPGNVLNMLPLDVFMRDYYEPKLFERLLSCTDSDTCEQEFRQTRSISELNIVRPQVRITDVSLPDAKREVKVSVEVSKASGLVEQGGAQRRLRTTGVYDLRLYRDRQLVGGTPSDGAEKIEGRKMEIDGARPESKFETELKVWRESTEVRLDPQTGKQTVSFKVQLPLGKDAAGVNFTAYAFNEDRVKSETARYEWTAQQKANLPKADPHVKRRAYVLSVGVNASRISKFSLSYADLDAREFQRVVPEKLRAAGVYEVVPVQLVSTYEKGRLVDDATKRNIKTVFEMLAGKNVPPAAKQKVPNFQRLEKATPDDLIIITISSHGYSNKNGDFYLLPSDIIKRTTRQEIPDLSSMISGEELALWLRDIEAYEMALIIDSCQAAAAVESLDFKPGPFGSRGFGQLAYDKRLKVLTATQADNRALEANGEIKGGLLTYALITEGLLSGNADSGSEKDGKITLDEWLNYGANRVYSLYKVVTSGKKKGLVWKRVHNSKDLNAGQLKLLQRALLFNFSRQDNEVLLSLAAGR